MVQETVEEMTITLEKLGGNVYGFRGLGDQCDCSTAVDGLCSDGVTTCTPDLNELSGSISTLLGNTGPSATGSSITCNTGETLIAGVCVGGSVASNNLCAAGYIQDDYGNCVLNGATATVQAAVASGSQYYSTSGQLIQPGNGTNGIPAGSYQVLNPTTGAVISTQIGTAPAIANQGQLIAGISNTTLAIGAFAALFVFVLLAGKR